MPSLDSYQRLLDELNAKQQLRDVRVLPDSVVDFSSNDYLGLSGHPKLIEAATDATRRMGAGTGGSRLISGTNNAILALESKIADWKKTEAALIFNSGYQANVGILQALLTPGDWVFWDRLNHASLVDGLRLSKAKWYRYKHLDLDDLATGLQKVPKTARKWIVTDTLFSMDGDYPDLKRLAGIAESDAAFLLVDEAHAAGVFGNERRSGLCEAQDISSRVTLQMGTFSKALGGFGAYVAGPQLLIDVLRNRARGFIYSTALPPSVIAAADAAIDLVWQDTSFTQTLWQNIDLIWQLLLESKIAVSQTAYKTQIIPIAMPDNETALRVSQALYEAGYFVQAIRSPTVTPGKERLRLSISAAHSETEIRNLMTALWQVCPVAG